jgi:2-oxoglutarate ferredoxin oxidoreductase subunit beta
MAINLGCGFVARSFSGSKKQLTALIKAGMSHNGMAIIDVISPCVTFANNDESYRSYGYVKDNEEQLHVADYIPHFSPIAEVDIPEGEYKDIELFDGSTLRLETISDHHDTSDVVAALSAIHYAEQQGKHVTGLLYFEADIPTADEVQGLVDIPLSSLPAELMRPSRAKHDELIRKLIG